jgi:hypothetical protein
MVNTSIFLLLIIIVPIASLALTQSRLYNGKRCANALKQTKMDFLSPINDKK